MTQTFKKLALTAVFAGGLLNLAGGAQAHHSFAAFDQGTTKTVTGTVKEWQWTNPHSWLEVTVATPGGGATQYSFETGSIYLLTRQKLNRHSFTAGEAVVVTYHPLRDGSNGGSLQGVNAPDGTVLLGGRRPPPPAAAP